jgi:hypothetical protein
VRLAHRAAQRADEVLVALEEARAAVGDALGRRAVLLPEQREGDALALELPMHPREIGSGEPRRLRLPRAEPRHQRRVVERCGFPMRQPRRLGTTQVVGDREILRERAICEYVSPHSSLSLRTLRIRCMAIRRAGTSISFCTRKERDYPPG